MGRWKGIVITMFFFSSAHFGTCSGVKKEKGKLTILTCNHHRAPGNYTLLAVSQQLLVRLSGITCYLPIFHWPSFCKWHYILFIFLVTMSCT